MFLKLKNRALQTFCAQKNFFADEWWATTDYRFRPMTKKWRHRLFLSLNLILFITFINGCKDNQKSQPPSQMPVKVEATQVKTAPVKEELTSVGNLSSPQETLVAPQISGRISSLNISQGTIIQKDEIIAKLDDAIQKAELAAAEAALSNARQIYQRDLDVLDTGGVSKQQLKSDEAAVKQAEAQQAQAKANLEYTVIRAPFTGMLGFRLVSLGAYLNEGDGIVHIRQIDPLYLDFDLPQQSIHQLRQGQTANFTVAGLSDKYFGTVTTIDPALNVGSRTVHVQATVENPKQVLKPGMFTKVNLTVGENPNALLVPAQSIVPEGKLRNVWIIGPHDTVSLVQVTVGTYQNNWVEILSGVKPTDRVITAGVQKLHPGAKVVITPYQPIHNERLDLANPEEKPS